jgi:hypothetical protein
MPTSRPNHLAWLCERVIKIRPESILDIGVGFGSKGMLFREYTDIWNGNYFEWKIKIDGVEIFEKYITDLQRHIYNKIYIGDILKLVDELGYYDMIHIGDVIEHVGKKEGLELIRKLKTKCKNLIVITPLHISVQGEVYGNVNETHVSQWTQADLGKQSIVLGNKLILDWEKPTVYYCEGMKIYGDRLRQMGFGKYDPLKPTLFLGLYFEDDYKVYISHQSERYTFWNGSDVLLLFRNKGWQESIRKCPAVHICPNEQLKGELKELGIEATIEPIFFADPRDYSINFNSRERLEVYINAHPGREKEYGVSAMLEAAKELPEVDFYVYGVDGESKDNVHYVGWLDEWLADEKMKNHHVCLRLNIHDGFSQLIAKAGLWGHHVITAQGIEDTIKVKNVKELIKEIKGLEGIRDPQLKLRERLLTSSLNKFSWL